MKLLLILFAVLLSLSTSRVLGSSDENLETRGNIEVLEDVNDGGGSNLAARKLGSGSSYKRFRNRGCRNYRGGQGSSNNEYNLYWQVSKSWCKRQCDKWGHGCYGYEYAATARGKCEVWRKPIFHVEHVNGLECNVKYWA